MNDGLIHKLIWMMTKEESPYKQAILQEAIDALADKTISSGEGILTVADDDAKVEFFGPQWHDAKDEPPEVNGEYLCFLRWPDGDGDFEVTFYVGEWTIERSDPVPVVLYWTEIPFLLEEDDASGEEVHLDGGDE